MDQRPLLRDLIDIKEHVAGSDYVLTLADAVTEAGSTKAVEDYVLTERLLGNFDEALSLIRSALDGDTSKPAFLHGSFGSGKSHFMAVLYALLSANPAARSRTEFDPVLTKHEWLLSENKKFLMVPYHMIDAKAMEQRVLGGYVDFVRAKHPEAPIPPVYRTDALFTDLRQLRATMGEDQFLAALNRDYATAEDDEWGESAAFWTSQRIDTALTADEAQDASGLNLVNPTTPRELRAKLVHDAGTTLLPGFTRRAAEDESGFISLDAGLSVIAAHAKSLGYDAIILFLDELILWLASLIHDEKRVAREASKITNFREGGDARRAIPIISFIARQRDLRELVGEELAGAAESAIQDALNHASGRFDLISLEDRNLPQIAHARLLKPRDAAAAQQIESAFEQTKKLGPKVWDTLLGSDESTTGADEASFRLSYPFSPAFLDTLVHISAALQRSRTGLKLMGQLLADHRNELRLGDLVPLGDLYEQLTRGGDRPFVADKKVLFDAADKLYKTRLRPYLLSTCEVTEDDIDAYVNRRETITDAKLAGNCKKFVGQNRLACTVLLAALAPSVPALRDLTIRRLGALNHGSITTMIPGREEGVIKDMIAEWAARFPEIKAVGTDTNPGVRLELSGVDVEMVIANAEVNDNPSNRATLARDLLCEELGLERANGRFDADELRFVWRGSNRVVEVVFGNVSDEDNLPNHDLQPTIEGRWRIVIDLPYDEGAHSPVEDAERIRRLREQQGDNHPRTVAWLPTHLTKPRWEDFRRLLVITKALADPYRFDTQYAQHLNPDNRASAKQLLESQRDTLRKNVLATFKQAYGLAERKPNDVTDDLTQHFHPLPDIDGLTVSIGQSMHDALRTIAGKLLSHQFPDHPKLDADANGTVVKLSDAKAVFAHVRSAAEARDGRVEVPSKDRPLMRRVAEPLGLGQQKEAYFELSRRWADHFRRTAQHEGVTGDLSVIALTDWTDLPQPRGLEPHIAHLVIASFAEMDDRVWVRGGVPIDAPELNKIQSGDALRTQPLPSESDWDAARHRFEVIFGAKAPTLRRGGLVQQFARQISEAASRHRDPATRLVEQLEKHAEFLGLDDTDPHERLALARRCVDLLTTLTTTGGGSTGAKKTVEALARFDLAEVNPDRYATSIKSAEQVISALTHTAWGNLAQARYLGPEGAALLDSLRGVARADQRSADLAQALRDTDAKVTALSTQRLREEAERARVTPPPATRAPRGGDVRPAPDDVDLGTPTSTPPLIDRFTPPAAPSDHRSGSHTTRSGEHTTTAAAAVETFAADIAALAATDPSARIEIAWRVIE
ncbi:BREX-2 system ATPase PglY [Nocardia otitidiscaviarum]|uniref:BREX-2 system ATPase PglY n=1 Tax=Nocardia otitidiscaviarum TaxID=1823 RepID=UPI002453CBA6|nr:phage resistance protein [Nocardia otitidiscaviarum]